jgi:N-acetylneuraminate lyase
MDAVDLPMLIYNIPAFSGVNLTVGNISEFLNDDRFIGVKHTSNDYFALEQYKAAFPDKIVYNGFDEMFLSGVSMGADGAIGSTYNFMADKFVAMQMLFAENNIHEAQKMQKEANRIIALLCKIGVIPAEKEVLNQLGFEFGECRHPFCSPTNEQKAMIAKEIIPYIKSI